MNYVALTTLGVALATFYLVVIPAALPSLPPVGGYNASASARSCAR